MEIPKDEYSTGHRDDQCWAKVYGATKKEAMAKANKYLGRYPSQGYNTNISWQSWITNSETGKRFYHIRMKRWHSCD